MRKIEDKMELLQVKWNELNKQCLAQTNTIPINN